MPVYVNDNLVQTNAIALTANSTIASATFATLLTLTVTTYGGNLLIGASTTSSNSTDPAVTNFRIQIDGTTVATSGTSQDGGFGPTAQEPQSTSLFVRSTTTAAGSHTITLQWSASAGTARINAASGTNGESAVLSFQEVYV